MDRRQRKSIVLGLVTVLALALFSGCGSGEKDSSRLRIVATTGMLGDAVKVLVDTLHRVDVIMGPGTDPHLYKPTPGDLDLLSNADIIIYNGHHLEGKMAEVLHKMGAQKITLAVAEKVDQSRIIKAEQDDSQDPHIWFDVSLWSEAVGLIDSTLRAADQANEDIYEDRAEAYLKELQDLHLFAKASLGLIPKKQRVLITAHDAFGYMGEAYDMDVRGLQGMSTTSAFGMADVRDLRDFIVENGIKAVFVETSVPHKSIEAVVEACQAMGHEVVIGGDLYSDAMGPYGSEADTYVGMVEHNVKTIASALR